MPVTVEEVVTVGPVAAANTATITLTTTPQSGDVLVLLAGQHRSSLFRTITVSGLGATWVIGANYADHRNVAVIGTGATAAGTVTASYSGSVNVEMTLMLVRGLASALVTAAAGGDGYGGASSVLTGSCSLGQIRIGHEVGFDAAMLTPVYVPTAPTTDWVQSSIVNTGGNEFAFMYRIGTAIGLQAHSINLDGATSGQTLSHLAFTLGTPDYPTVQVEAVYAESLVTGLGAVQTEAVYAESLVTGLGQVQVEAIYAEALTPRPAFTADPAYRAAVMADAPLGYWRLDEKLGAPIIDYSATANNGTYSGVLQNKDPLHAGSIGSVQGSGSGQGIGTVPNHASWVVGETFSLECWIQPTNTTDIAGVVGRYVAATGGWVIWQRRGKLGVVVVKSGTQTDQDGFTIAVNVPVHFVLVSVPGKIRIYVNGRLAFTTNTAGTYNAAVDTTGLQFGGYNGAANYSQTRLSDVAFYGVALTDAQIAAHLGLSWPPTAVDPATIPGLAGRWDALTLSGADGSAVASWADTSGNGKDLATLGLTRNPLLKKAIFNGRQVVRFDGTDDALAATVITPADNQVTIIAVHAVRTIPAVAPGVLTMQPSVATASGYGMVLKATTGERSIWSVAAYTAYGGGVYTAGTWERWALYSNVSQAVLLVNGVVAETNIPIAGVAGYLRLAGSPTQTNPGAVDFAEVLVFDRALTFYEIAQVDLYLKEKWFDTVAPPPAAALFIGWGSPRIALDAPAPVFVGLTYPNVVMANTPLAYWRFRGDTAIADESGNNRHLSLQTPAAAVFTTGAYDDKLAMYPGTTAAIPYAAWMGIATWELEMVFTFRPAALGNASGNIVDRDQGGGSLRGFQVVANFVGGIGIIQYIQTVGTITSFLTSGHPDLRDGLPHHLVINQGGGQLKMYIDGVLRGGGANAQQTPSLSPIGVGASYAGGAGSGGYPTAQPMAGVAIDELAFYDHVSTPEAIAARYDVLMTDVDYKTARVSTAYDLAVAADAPTRRFRMDESNKSYNLFMPSWAHGTYTAVSSAGALVNGHPNDRSAVFVGASYATVDIPVAATAFSIEMWLEPDSSPGGQYVAGRWEGTGNYSWFIYRDSTAISITMYFAGDKALFSSVPMVLNTRNHLVCTYDGANIRIYVNGVLGGTLAQTGNATAGGTSRLGRININPTMFTGKMDEVASYSTVLSPARILAHYNAGVQAVSVVEVARASGGFVGSHTIALAATPAFGDVVVVVASKVDTTSVSGLGATWVQGGGYTGAHEVWIGTGATAAGNVTISGDTNYRNASLFLVRGLSSTAVVSDVGGQGAGPLMASRGQFVLAVPFSKSSFTSTKTPATGWTTYSVSPFSGEQLQVNHRVPTEVTPTEHMVTFSNADSFDQTFVAVIG